MKGEFPFSDPPDTACFSCCHVIDGHRPILYVSHDDDGYWQFLCGGSHKSEDARLVSLRYVLSIDSSVAVLAGLDYGEYAEAEDEYSDWVVRRSQ